MALFWVHVFGFLHVWEVSYRSMTDMNTVLSLKAHPNMLKNSANMWLQSSLRNLQKAFIGDSFFSQSSVLLLHPSDRDLWLFLSFFHFVSSCSILFYESSSDPGDHFNLDKLIMQNTRFDREVGTLTKVFFFFSNEGSSDSIRRERSDLMRAFISTRRHSNEENLNKIRFCISRRLNTDSVIDKLFSS